MESKNIYEIIVVQSYNDWFRQRRYPRFDTIIANQILYYSKEETEEYIKLAVAEEAYAALICFIVIERPMDVICYSEHDSIWVYDQNGRDATSINHQIGDIVEVLKNDEIELGFVTDVKNGMYTVITSSNMKNSLLVDARHIFKPHFKIPVRTERRLNKAVDTFKNKNNKQKIEQ